MNIHTVQDIKIDADRGLIHIINDIKTISMNFDNNLSKTTYFYSSNMNLTSFYKSEPERSSALKRHKYKNYLFSKNFLLEKTNRPFFIPSHSSNLYYIIQSNEKLKNDFFENAHYELSIFYVDLKNEKTEVRLLIIGKNMMQS